LYFKGLKIFTEYFLYYNFTIIKVNIQFLYTEKIVLLKDLKNLARYISEDIFIDKIFM